MKEEDKNKWEIEKKENTFCDCGNMLKKKKTNRKEILVPQTSVLMVHSRSFSVHWASEVEVVAVSEVWFHSGPRTLETSLKCLSRGTKKEKKKRCLPSKISEINLLNGSLQQRL